MNAKVRHWKVTRAVTLGGPPEPIWALIGGFFTMHHWHPDIALTEVPSDQTDVGKVRRLLTFPGQPKTTEELICLDDEEFHYRYKWHAGEWGEQVKNYHASLRVIGGDLNKTSVVQWIGEFDNAVDAISQFYENGFVELRHRFPVE